MEGHIKVIREFIDFCSEIDRSKSVKNFQRLVAGELTPEITKRVIEDAKKLFSTIDYNNITNKDILEYKTGFVNLHRVQQLCKGDDLDTFKEYMRLFEKLYSDHTDAVNKLITELDMPLDSPEALFMKRLFNELGQEFIDIAKDSSNFNIESLIPKMSTLFKNGKLMELFTSFKNSDLKMSRILISVGRLLEKYETQ